MSIDLKVSDIKLGMYAEEKLREAISYREKATKNIAYFQLYAKAIHIYHMAYNRIQNQGIKEHLQLIEEDLERRHR